MSSITSCQARRSPSFVGCQPRRAGIGWSEMPPPDTTVLRAAPPPLSRTRRFAGLSRPSSSAAESTASVAESSSRPDASASPRTKRPPTKTTRPAATLTVAWPPKTSRPRKRWLRLTCVTPLWRLVYRLVTNRSATSALVTPSSAVFAFTWLSAMPSGSPASVAGADRTAPSVADMEPGTSTSATSTTARTRTGPDGLPNMAFPPLCPGADSAPGVSERTWRRQSPRLVSSAQPIGTTRGAPRGADSSPIPVPAKMTR